MEIRMAVADDIPLIKKLAYEIWPQCYASILTAEQLNYMLDLIYSEKALARQMDNSHVFLIAQHDNVALGFASYSEESPGFYKLHKLYLLPSEQGKGTGKWLIDQVLHQVRAKGATAIRLNVNRKNKARSFYEKAGFSIVGSEDINIGKGFFMNDFVMEKTLHL